MTPIVSTIRLPVGELRFPLVDHERVGDRLVPVWIEVDFPGTADQPSFLGRIEVQRGVPRWASVAITQRAGGREVREKDLRAIELDSWIETFVAAASGRIRSDDGTQLSAEFSADPGALKEAARIVQDARKGSRRIVTDTLKRQTAEIYNAHESGGLDAIEAAFAVSRSTAQRYLRAARAAGYVQERK